MFTIFTAKHCGLIMKRHNILTHEYTVCLHQMYTDMGRRCLGTRCSYVQLILHTDLKKKSNEEERASDVNQSSHLRSTMYSVERV